MNIKNIMNLLITALFGALLAYGTQAMLCDPEVVINFDRRHEFMDSIKSSGNKELIAMFEEALNLSDRESNLERTKDLDVWILSKSSLAQPLEKTKQLVSSVLFEKVLVAAREVYQPLRELLLVQYEKHGRWNEWPLFALLRLLQLVATTDGYLDSLKENTSKGLDIFPQISDLNLSKEESQEYLEKLRNYGLLETNTSYDPAYATKQFFTSCPDVREMMIAGGHVYKLGADLNDGKFVVNIDPLRAPDVTSDIYDENFLAALPKNQFTKIYEDSNIPDILTKEGSESSTLARTLYEALVDGGELISVINSFPHSERNEILLRAGFIPVYISLPDRNKEEMENIILQGAQMERSEWDKLTPTQKHEVVSRVRPTYAKNLKIEEDGWKELHHFKK